MTIKTAFQNTINTLAPNFGEREATNLSRILFEDRFQIYQTNKNGDLSIEQQEDLQTLVNKLLQGEPIQYLLGQTNFYGLTFAVSPDVLIPRPETEELVYLISETIKTKKIQIGMDIGTGSGCIPITLKHKYPNWIIHASDVSPGALKVAEQNAAKNNTPIDFHEFDILDEKQWPVLPGFDFIVSNPPYIPPSEKKLMPNSVLNFEPEIALFVPEGDPLLFYKKITAFANKYLKNEGYLFFEANEFNAAEVARLLTLNGFEKVLMEKDMQGKLRMVYGLNE